MNSVRYSIFTLADHLNFAIQRAKKGMAITNPMVNEIRHLYEKEMKLGEWAIKLIRKRLNVVLPRTEAGNIAMHFIDAKVAVTTACRKIKRSSLLKILQLL
ncbi:MAG: PRD domain-containing protein [Holdemanella porci]